MSQQDVFVKSKIILEGGLAGGLLPQNRPQPKLVKGQKN